MVRRCFSAFMLFMARIDRLNLGLISAGVAFYGMLAMFPAAAAVIAIWGFVADPDIVAEQLALTQEFLPAEAYALINSQITRLITTSSTAFGWTTGISLAAALWSARAGVAALIRGLNAVHELENRGGVVHSLIALGLTLALVGVGLIALGSIVVVPIVLAFLPLGPWAGIAFQFVRWGVTVFVILSALGLVYRLGPNREKSRKGAWITLGALVALGLWALVSYGLTQYLANFGVYNKIYGALGAVIALLMWLYLTALVVLIGALIDKMREPSDA